MASTPARRRAPPGAFDLVEGPALTWIPGARLAVRRATGAYVPWSRLQTLDEVAFTLEKAGVPTAGPPVGLYYDLPRSDRPEESWEADFGYPVPADAPLPRGLVERAFEDAPAIGLRYRGDLSSFPAALLALLSWAEERGIAAPGHLVERFHLSDPLTLAEERDVWIALGETP